MNGGKQLLIEAWVNLPMRWELQFVGSCSCFVYDHEGADALVVELLLGSWKVKIGGVQPDLVADLVVTRCHLPFVILSLHVGHHLLKRVVGLLMNIAHRCYELLCCWIRDGIVVEASGMSHGFRP